jgi:folate-binding protein YgfZ
MAVSAPTEVFTHPRLEYEALTHTVGLLDLPHVGVLRLRGNDRVPFLNAMVTNDVAKLAGGGACEALLTTTKGRVVAKLMILARADELLVLVMGGSTARVFEALDSHIVADDVTLTDMSEEMVVLSLQGPKSREVVWRIFPREPLPIENLKFTENEYQGMHAMVLRHSITGEKGLHVIVSRGQSERMRDFLEQAGVGMDMRVVGRVGWNMRRIEAGLPWYGVDVTEDNFPKEARLDGYVSYDKGCFLGQEPIARMHYRGHPNWLLVGLAVDEAPATFAYPEHLERVKELPTLATDPRAVRADVAVLSLDYAAGAELFTLDADDVHAIADEISEGGPARGEDAAPPKAVGRLTSGTLSPRLQRALFLGYVRATAAETGTKFRARVGGADLTLSIVELPLPGPIKGEKHA